MEEHVEETPAKQSVASLLPISIGGLAVAIVIAAFIMRPQQPQYIPVPTPTKEPVTVRVKPSPPIQPGPLDGILKEIYGTK